MITSSQNGSVYGVPQTYSFRACRDASETFCGPDVTLDPVTPINANSIPTPVYTETSTDQTLNRTGRWSFTLPTGAYQGVSYQCGGSDIQPAPGNTCDGTGPDLLTGPSLLIRVTANGGQTYDKTYDAPLLPSN
jgi:hypothetical protein